MIYDDSEGRGVNLDSYPIPIAIIIIHTPQLRNSISDMLYDDVIGGIAAK